MELTEGRKTDPEPKPRIIGITGGIGSGKSTVAQFIEEKGFPVYYSDDRAKELVSENENLKTQIKQLLGDEAYDEQGKYNRKYVAQLVFENTDLLDSLNGLIHPAVRLDFENWLQKQHSKFVFKETALLYELDLDKDCFQTILVTAEDNLRIKRVMDRDQKTYREVETIMNNQMPEKDKIKKADYIICNNEGLEVLKTETDRIINQLLIQE